MKTVTGIIPDIPYSESLTLFPAGDVLFLDIETTGFSRAHDFVYLIGVVFFQEKEWHYIQWLSAGPAEEASILREFLDFSATRPVLIHFNGNSFDLPFLAGRAELHGIPYTLEKKTSLDLYRLLKPAGRLFSLPHRTLAGYQELLGKERKDEHTGKELIPVYQKYVSGYFPENETPLLSHNLEDLRATADVCRLLVFNSLSEGRFHVAGAASDSSGLMLTLSPGDPFPVGFQHTAVLEEPDLQADLYAEKESCRLQLKIPAFSGTLYHYIPDWKDYCYLPAEDMAIHKSIASFVDRENRVQATADTCYIKKEGFFAYQPSVMFEPEFRRTRRGASFFELTAQMTASPSVFQVLAASLLSQILQ